MKLRDDIFISTTFSNNINFNEILKECFDNKLLNLELGSTHKYNNNYERIIKKYQLRYITHNFFPPRKNNLILNIASLNHKIKKESIEHIKYCIKFSKNIGSELYSFHPGFINDPLNTSQKGRNYDFLWEKKKSNNHNKVFNNMVESIKLIVDYANKIKMKVAIETEGSYYNSDNILLQKPSDFVKMFKHIDKNTLNFNLNLGHLNLASNLYKFKKIELINLIYERVVALEISHNNSLLDQHKYLTKTSPCLSYLNKFTDKKVFKILEFRDTNIKNILKSIKILKRKLK